MKTTLFVLGCLTLALASCGSPEERAANTTTDSTVTATTTDTATSATATPAPDTAAKATTPATTTPAATTPAATATAKTEAAKPAAKAPAGDLPGKALIAKADCLACHSLTQKIVGPAYQNVAVKYAATDENIEQLADKIIAGGQGVWGAVPMTPHPTLSKSDAKEMVKYILSLKK